VSYSEKPKLVLIDDDPLIVDSLSIALQDEFDVLTADSRKQLKSRLQVLDKPPSLALVDLGLPPFPHIPDEGFHLIEELLAINDDIKILVLSGQNEQSNIQHSLTLGAVDFIPKPCDVVLLKARLQHQLMMLEAEQVQASSEQQDKLFVGESDAIKNLMDLVAQFADTPYPVLIEGESGTGKELVARLLHDKSARSSSPHLTINCAAFTPELLEAQLFGHAKGAFTGATSARAGFFEESLDGTLFLDEVGELPFELQSKLLRVLENGEYYRIGETQPQQSQARILTATNRDLRDEVRAGHFRQDLYHRLSVLTVYVPPLRERRDDCLKLLDYFRSMYAGKSSDFKLNKQAQQGLLEYTFPGNIRELRNIVIRLSAKYPGKTVGIEELRAEMETEVISSQITSDLDDVAMQQELMDKSFRLDECLSVWEKRYIDTALQLSGGNLSKAARMLGVNRTTLYSRLQRLNIKTPE